MSNAKGFPAQEALYDIHYELVQLVNCISAMLVKHPDLTSIPSFSSTIRNALLESCLLHTRNLADFFGNKRLNDDILAQDFGFPGKAGIVAEKYKARINKNLSHLTYSRIQYRVANDVEWDPADNVSLLNIAQSFVEFMLQNRLRNGDKAEIAKWEDLLKGIDMILGLLAKS